MEPDGPHGPAERATIARRASRGFLASLVRVGLNQIAAGAALIIFARRLDGAEFALFTAFGLGAPLAYRLLTAPLSWVLIRQKAQPSGALVTSVVAVVEAAVLMIGAAVLAVGAALGAWPLRVGLAAVVYVIVLPLCLPALVGLYRDVDVSRAAALEAVDRVAFYTLAAAGVLAGMGTDALVLAFLGTAGAMLVSAQLLRPWRPARPAPRSAYPLLRQAIATGATIAVAAVSDLAMVPFVAVLAGGHQAGLWSWAYSAAYLVPLGVVGAAMNALFAAFARLPEEALASDTAAATRLVTVAGGVVAALAAAVVPAAETVVFPHRWHTAYPALWMAAAAAGALAAGAALSMLWNARLSTTEFACWQAIVLGAGYAAGLAAVPLFGAAGFAGAYLGAQVVLTTVLVRAAHGRLGIALAGPVLRILAACAVAGLCGVLLERSLGPGAGTMVAAAAVVFAVAGCLLFAFERRSLLSDARGALAALRGAS
jgi:O-antigen/teichoic acid export membrane protein